MPSRGLENRRGVPARRMSMIGNGARMKRSEPSNAGITRPSTPSVTVQSAAGAGRDTSACARTGPGTHIPARAAIMRNGRIVTRTLIASV
jgi:hypothetical protein